MEVQNRIVSVFKTLVTNKGLSEKIVKEIMIYNYVIACNFDLDDCDKILRIESENEISIKVIALLHNKDLICEELI
jgi:hypothetical protein